MWTMFQSQCSGQPTRIYAVLFTLLLCGLIHGQESKKMPVETVTISLEHTEADGIAKVLTKLYGSENNKGTVIAIADPKSNRVIIRATAAELKKILNLIQELDRENRNTLRIHRLQHVKVNTALERTLAAVLSESKAQFAFDERTNTILIQGAADALEKAEALLKVLDVPDAAPIAATSTVQLRVLWLMNGKSPTTAQLLPDDLKKLEASVARLGLGKLWVAGQTIISAQPTKKFEIRGQANLGEKQQAHWSVEGQLRFVDQTAEIEIQILGNLEKKNGERGSPTALCTLATQITAPPGHVVLLGATPVSGRTSVFAVQLIVEKK